MNEDLLRAMIRESISRHAGGRVHREEGPGVAPQPFSAHPSHFRYTLPASGGPCLIEPGVACSHCGFCESHGH